MNNQPYRYSFTQTVGGGMELEGISEHLEAHRNDYLVCFVGDWSYRIRRRRPSRTRCLIRQRVIFWCRAMAGCVRRRAAHTKPTSLAVAAEILTTLVQSANLQLSVEDQSGILDAQSNETVAAAEETPFAPLDSGVSRMSDIPTSSTMLFGKRILGRKTTLEELRKLPAWNGVIACRPLPPVGQRIVFPTLTGKSAISAHQQEDGELRYDLISKDEARKTLIRKGDVRTRSRLVAEDGSENAVGFLCSDFDEDKWALPELLDFVRQVTHLRMKKSDWVDWVEFEESLRLEIKLKRQKDSWVYRNGDDNFLYQWKGRRRRMIYLNQAKPEKSCILPVEEAVELEKAPELYLETIVGLPQAFQDRVRATLLKVPFDIYNDTGNRIKFLATIDGRIIAGRLRCVVQVHFESGDVLEICRDRSNTELVVFHYAPKTDSNDLPCEATEPHQQVEKDHEGSSPFENTKL